MRMFMRNCILWMMILIDRSSASGRPSTPSLRAALYWSLLAAYCGGKATCANLSGQALRALCNNVLPIPHFTKPFANMSLVSTQ